MIWCGLFHICFKDVLIICCLLQILVLDMISWFGSALLPRPVAQVGADHAAHHSLRRQIRMWTTSRFWTCVFETSSVRRILQCVLFRNLSLTYCSKCFPITSFDHGLLFWLRYSSNGSGWCCMEGHLLNPQFAGVMMITCFLDWSFPQVWLECCHL